MKKILPIILCGLFAVSWLLLASPQPVQAEPLPMDVDAPVGCVEHITNGSFESGNLSSWVTSGGPWVATYAGYDGSNSAVVGGDNSRDDTFYQAVTLPVDANSITLSYWWYIYSEEAIGSAYDYAFIEVHNTSGGVLRTLDSLSDQDTRGTWVNATFNLKDYPELLGQTVRVSFNGLTDNSNFTSFYFDKISLEICTGPSVDVSIDEMEVTQGIQNLAHDVPLIAGKRTWVRIYQEAISQGWDVDVLLEGNFNGNPTYPSSITCGKTTYAQTTAALYQQRLTWDDSINCQLPAGWINQPGNLWLRATVSPVNAFDPQPGDNQKTLIFNVKASPPVNMQIVQVRDGGFLGIGAKGPQHHEYPLIHWLAQEMYPVSKINMHPHTFWVPWLGNKGTVTAIGAADLFHKDPGPNTIYMGAVRPEVRTMYGGMATASGFGWTLIQPSFYYRTAAHEMGHTYGLKHVPCNVTDQTDPNYPYPDRWISAGWASDHFGLATYINPPKVLNPQEHTEFMSYCQNRWISDYHFKKLFNNLTAGAALTETEATNGPVGDSPRVVVPQADTEYLVAAGYLADDEKSATLLPLMRVMGADLENEAHDNLEGTYLLNLLGAGDGILSSTAFGIPEDHLGVKTPFILLVPYQAGTQRVVVELDGVELASVSVSANAPTLALEAVSGTVADDLKVYWTASDVDGDDLTTTILFSPDGGTTWQTAAYGVTGETGEIDTTLWPQTSQGMLKVLVTDGINTTTATTGPFSVAAKVPLVYIVNPDVSTDIRPGTSIVLQAFGYDAEDGEIDENSFSWESDEDGYLGFGQEIMAAGLSDGWHQITVTGTDNDLNTATDTINIFVGYRLLLPLIAR